jgi:hypothetical protein
MNRTKIKLSLIATFSSLTSIVMSYYVTTFLFKAYVYSKKSPYYADDVILYLFVYFFAYPILAGSLSAIIFYGGITYFKKTDTLTIHTDTSVLEIFFITSVLSFIVAYKLIWLDG